MPSAPPKWRLMKVTQYCGSKRWLRRSRSWRTLRAQTKYTKGTIATWWSRLAGRTSSLTRSLRWAKSKGLKALRLYTTMTLRLMKMLAHKKAKKKETDSKPVSKCTIYWIEVGGERAISFRHVGRREQEQPQLSKWIGNLWLRRWHQHQPSQGSIHQPKGWFLTLKSTTLKIKNNSWKAIKK